MALVRQKVHGADLSHHNPDPDLKKAKAAGLLFLYHKATEGVTVTDPKYVARRKAAKTFGIPFGAYHFARPDAHTTRDARTEAQFFMRKAAPLAGDLVPVLDFEVKSSVAEKWSKEFMDEVGRILTARKLQGRPMHYGPDDFGADYPYLRWVPRYNNTNTKPRIKWDIWQFSNGKLGIPNSFPGLGHVDLNTMRDGLSLSAFRLRPIKTPPKPPVNPNKPKKATWSMYHVPKGTPQYFGDSRAGLDEAKRLKKSRADINVLLTLDNVPVGAHYQQPLLHGAVWRKDTPPRLTGLPKSVMIRKLMFADLKYLVYKYEGLTIRISSIRALLNYGKKIGVGLEIDLKNEAKFRTVAGYTRLMADIKATKTHPVLKVVGDVIKKPEQYLVAAKKAGGTTLYSISGHPIDKKYETSVDYFRGVKWVTA